LTSETVSPARRVPRRLLFRFGLLMVLVVGGFVALKLSPLGHHLNEHDLLADFQKIRQSPWAPAALLAAYVVLCPIGLPATPLMVTGAVLFGAVWGAVWNVLGTVLGGTVTYFLGRLLGRDFVAHFAGKRLKKIERQISKRGFWGLVGIRFLPLPFAIVNYTAALVGIPPALFLATMTLGLLLPNILYTYVFNALYHAASGERAHVYLNLAIAISLLAVLMFLPQVIVGRKRKKRYEEIRARRRGGALSFL
jgi:phospholipase D1/2